MSNCIVSKMKSAVNVNNPLYLGYITLHVDQSAISQAPLSQRIIKLNYSSTEYVTLKNIGGNFLDSSGNVIGTTIDRHEGGRKTYYFDTNTQQILVPKYNLLGLIANDASGLLYITASDLEYAQSINDLQLGGQTNVLTFSDIAAIKTDNNFGINLNQVNLSGDISVMAKQIKLTSMIFGTPDNSKITGDFATWAPYRPASIFTYKTTMPSSSQLKCNGELVYTEGVVTYLITFDGNGGVTWAPGQS